jgi:uncharacterized protein (TIGR02996 family)
MNDRLTLLSAIHDLPADDLPRLAYADWMEENGQPERGEFIRIHLAMERTPRRTPEYRRLWEREVELIRTYKDEWFGTFRFYWHSYEVKRGFLDEVSSFAQHVVPHANWLLENHAVQKLGVTASGLGALEELLRSPLVATLWRLRFWQELPPSESVPYHSEDGPLPGAELPLARRPLDARINTHPSQPSEDVVRVLAASPFLDRLTRLSVIGARLGEAGVSLLLSSMANWPNLTQLVLPAVTPQARSLRHRVAGTNLAPRGVIALITSPQAARLQLLDLTGEDLNQTACEAFLDSPHLNSLEWLRLTRPPRRLRELAAEIDRRFSPRLTWSGAEE